MEPSQTRWMRGIVLVVSVALISLSIWFFSVRGSERSPDTTDTPRGATETPARAICLIDPPDGEEAITKAIAGCPNGSTVQFPREAVYHQSAPIDVIDRVDLVIDGGGSTFINTAPNTASVLPNWRVVRGRDVTLRKMGVRGNFRLNGPRGIGKVSTIAINQHNAGFLIAGGNGVTVADVNVKDTFGDFVLVAPDDSSGRSIPRNVRIRRLDGERAARQCVALSAAVGFWLEDSILRDCWYGAIDIERDLPDEPIRGVHLLRNTFDGFNLFAIAVPAPGNSGATNGLEIRDNTILRAGDTCRPPIVVGQPDKPNRILNVVVENNELKGLGGGISLQHVQGGSVRNNQLTRTIPYDVCGPPVSKPISIDESVDVVISGNIITGYNQ